MPILVVASEKCLNVSCGKTCLGGEGVMVGVERRGGREERVSERLGELRVGRGGGKGGGG